MNLIKERREQGALCPSCRNPCYVYEGRAMVGEGGNDEYWFEHGKHCFRCPQCHAHWQDGNSEDSLYYRLRDVE